MNLLIGAQQRDLEAQLVSAAQAGEVNGLVEYIYRKLAVRAERLARTWEKSGMCLEGEDMVQEGIEQVLANLQKGLTQKNPMAWLLVVAWRRMTQYCIEFQSPIRVPKTSQWRGRLAPRVASLDAPLIGREDFTLLDLIASR